MSKLLAAVAAVAMAVTPTPTPAQTPKDARQIECLARNAYFEAGGEGRQGMRAVTNVVMNRVKDPRFGDTPCEVVHQKDGRRCQFSWVCSPRAVRDWKLYERCKEVATMVYYGRLTDVTGGALFFHAARLSGSWFKRNLERTIRIGNHVFYR